MTESSADDVMPDGPSCARCSVVFMPWITTCPTCDIPLDGGHDQPLAEQVAPLLEPTPRWIDIAVASDEPAKVALLVNFLKERKFVYEQSRRFISVPSSDAVRLGEAIELWAFNQSMPDDDRHHDSLAATMRDIGNAVIDAIYVSSRPAETEGRRGIDLR